MNVLITGSNKGLGFGLTNYYLGIRNKVYGISREMNSELNNHSNHSSLLQYIF
jgi:short-subunit dehydrogenase involved in D-alanine esterification of teichoic acids